MQRQQPAFSMVNKQYCIYAWNHNDPCCAACPNNHSMNLAISGTTSFPGAMTSSRKTGSEMGTHLDGLPGRLFNQFEAETSISSAVAQNDSSYQYNSSYPQGPSTPWNVSLSADRVLLDVAGMDTRASERMDPHLQSEQLVDGEDHPAYGDTHGRIWNDSHQESGLPYGHLDPHPRGNAEEVNMVYGKGQHNTSLLLTDCNEAVNALSLGDDVGVDPLRDLQQPSQQLSPGSPIFSNLDQHPDMMSETNPFLPPDSTFAGSYRDMPWTPWTPVAIANLFNESSSPHGRCAPRVSVSTVCPSLTCYSPSAFTGTDTSDTSSHPYLMPGLSATQGPQEVTMEAGHLSEAQMAIVGQQPDIVQMERRVRSGRDDSARSYLNPSSCSDYVAVDVGAEGGSLSRSSSNHLLVPNDGRRRRRASSPAPSEASITPSVVVDVLTCHILGCSIAFSGAFRRGNLHRHIRLVHNQVRFPCGVRGCPKTFNRQDARLNHYRKKHADDLASLRPLSKRGKHEVG